MKIISLTQTRQKNYWSKNRAQEFQAAHFCITVLTLNRFETGKSSLQSSHTCWTVVAQIKTAKDHSKIIEKHTEINLVLKRNLIWQQSHDLDLRLSKQNFRTLLVSQKRDSSRQRIENDSTQQYDNKQVKQAQFDLSKLPSFKFATDDWGFANTV